MILSDRQIIFLCEHEQMIAPFKTKLISRDQHGKCISYGTSSYGYDARIANEFKIFSNAIHNVIDPKKFRTDSYIDHVGDSVIIPPNSFVLGRTVEYFKIPRDVLAICLGKSTYARCGLIVNVTPLEPAWQGHVTIEISNTTPLPAVVYANEGICQFVFLKGADACHTSYADRCGKYQGQTGVSLAQV